MAIKAAKESTLFLRLTDFADFTTIRGLGSLVGRLDGN